MTIKYEVRLIRDIEDLKKVYQIEFNGIDEIKYMIPFTKKILFIKIPHSYPFEAPIVLYDNKKLPHLQINDICMSCNNPVICPNLWTPIIRLKTIVNDCVDLIKNYNSQKDKKKIISLNLSQSIPYCKHRAIYFYPEIVNFIMEYL